MTLENELKRLLGEKLADNDDSSPAEGDEGERGQQDEVATWVGEWRPGRWHRDDRRPRELLRLRSA